MNQVLSVPMQIFEESEVGRQKLIRTRTRLGKLSHLYPSQYNFPKWIEAETCSGLKRPTFADLKEAYCKYSSSRRSSMECYRTPAERAFLMRVQSASKKAVHTSLWIGAHCTDLFVPNVRSQTNGHQVMRGLAIEIDGDAHNHEEKMRKDELKLMTLSMIGIGVLSVPNNEFGEKTVQHILGNLNRLRPLDSRDRRRLWTRIYALTLAIHLSDKQFSSIFNGGI